MEKRTYAFDLDGTLCSLTNGQYETCEPFVQRIEHVNSLHRMGHEVIIFTARGATSGRDLYSFTFNQLRFWGVEFDRLVTGKPHFDLLIDDKATSDKSYFSGVIASD